MKRIRPELSNLIGLSAFLIHMAGGRARRATLAIGFCLFVMEFLTPATALAATCVVTSFADFGAGTLRDCLAVSQDGDIIDATGISGTIVMSTGGTALQVNRNVTINGPGPLNLTIDGSAAHRVFEILAPNVTITGLTIMNGKVSGAPGGGGILNRGGLTLRNSIVKSNSVIQPSAGSGDENGGGISNLGTLKVINSTVSGNSAFAAGGGIYSFGSAGTTVEDSIVSDNLSSNGFGGGLANSSQTMEILNSTVESNDARFGGGGIVNVGATLMVKNSTVKENRALNGGGIMNRTAAPLPGTVTVINSTISSNVANNVNEGLLTASGGGLYNEGTLNVINSTVSQNANVDTGVTGGGGAINNKGTLTIKHSTFSDNHAEPRYLAGLFSQGGATTTTSIGDTVLNGGDPSDGYATIFAVPGSVTSLGYNLSSDGGGGALTASTDQVFIDPMLGPLQNNGGRPSRMRCCQAALPLMPATRVSIRTPSLHRSAPTSAVPDFRAS
jgi:parallel beta-helix repeat protein